MDLFEKNLMYGSGFLITHGELWQIVSIFSILTTRDYMRLTRSSCTFFANPGLLLARVMYYRLIKL